MSSNKKKSEKQEEVIIEEPILEEQVLDEVCDITQINKLYNKKCGNNKAQLESELKNREELDKRPNEDQYLYPTLDDPNFNVKIAQKKEFVDTKYDGTIYSVEDYAKVLSTAEYELLPQQAFVRNFLSFQTPYNSLLLFHGLGSGKTCSAIGVCEEMRDYLRQIGVNKRIIIVASPNVQDNFKLQLFDERKLKEVDGIWTMKGCLGNKLLKEINPTGMKGLKREKVIQQVKNLINVSYSFQGYLQFSNEIVRKSGKTDDSMESKIRNLQVAFSDSLIVIDEVHNIRISDDNENKNVAKNLMFLVSIVSNLRLLLLSATPMFNSYKEIVWLLNLMNMNDRRGIISVSDIFDINGKFKVDKDGNEIGKDILIRKATGYVSYVRGENPYTFPFRVYPNRFALDHTFKSVEEYPKYQINGKKIPKENKADKLSLFLTAIGEYQQMGYKYIIHRLRSRGDITKVTRAGKERKMATFDSLKAFGYTDLQIPIEALNIVYPFDGLEEIVSRIPQIEFSNEFENEEEQEQVISPILAPEKEIVAEIDDVMNEGPQISKAPEIVNANSELESEPAITEGVEADESVFDQAVEPDASHIPSIHPTQEQIIDSKEKPKKKAKKIDFEITNPNEEIVELKRELAECNNKLEEHMKAEHNSVTTKPVTSKKVASKKKKKELLVEPSIQPIKKQTPKLVPKATSKSKSKPNPNDDEGLHIVEGLTHTNYPDEKNPINNFTEAEEFKGGAEDDELNFDPKELTGSQGLRRIMNFVDSKSPAIKGQFEYKRGVPHVFDKSEIGKYSGKIHNICNYIYNPKTQSVAEGIILIYSSYIDAGVIPMALALEEMGFQRFGEKAKTLFKDAPSPAVDVRTMKPPTNRKDFRPARYVMITGDTRISPNNDADVKAITSNDNIFDTDKDGNLIDISGEKIKVVIISQAGSEGLDFKAIRQVHILEPWYNVNRIEQIIGRAVRNFSHKDLPFFKRNVQIFLYGTILQDAEEEAADLYIYRIAELKAVKIGKVSRLLKQTAVDCIINHDQTQFTSENFNKIEENQDIYQVLSDHQKLDHFVIGDMDNTPTCDFMECEFKCLPDLKLEDSELNTDTYNETFMLVNSDKIIQKIKSLMKMRYFYKKKDLLQLINIPKPYPISQIYAALTQIIEDHTEYITDKYGRTGYLINIGEYYLFQPSELNYNNISVFDRSVPIDFKHEMIRFEFKPNITEKSQLETDIIEKVEPIEDIKGKTVLDNMFANYNLALSSHKVERGNDNWYQHSGIVIRKMSKENEIIPADSEKERLEILEQFLIEHIVDSLMMDEKVDLLNYIYANRDVSITNSILKRFFGKAKRYILSKLISAKGLTGIVTFDGPSRVENLHIFVLDGERWTSASPEDKRDLGEAILKKYRLKNNLNHYVGFIGFETNKKYMVYKLKDTHNERSTGFRCDQSGKEKIIKILNEVEADERYISKVTKEGAIELCVRQELTLRSLENQKIEGKTWFLDTETAIINEFEKKEKGK